MSETEHTPLRPPLRPPAQPGDGRDREIFDRLDAEIAAEDNAGKEAAPVRRKRKPRAAPHAGYRGTRSRQNRLRPAKKKPARPESEAFIAAKETAVQAGQRIRAEQGDKLSRTEPVKLARALLSAIVPPRKPGRRPKAQVTAAVADWKRGVRGEALFSAHIRGWERMSRWRQRGEKRMLMDAIRSRNRRGPRPALS